MKEINFRGVCQKLQKNISFFFDERHIETMTAKQHTVHPIIRDFENFQIVKRRTYICKSN